MPYDIRAIRSIIKKRGEKSKRRPDIEECRKRGDPTLRSVGKEETRLQTFGQRESQSVSVLPPRGGGRSQGNIIMTAKQKTVKLLHQKIDECDDLIVEISQLRYRLDAIIAMLNQTPSPTTPRKKKHDNSVA